MGMSAEGVLATLQQKERNLLVFIQKVGNPCLTEQKVAGCRNSKIK